MYAKLKYLGLPILMALMLVSNAYSEQRKALIVYFSMPERNAVDAVAGASHIVEKGTVVGNVEWIARNIQGRIRGDLIALKTVQLYPAYHALLVKQASEERLVGARPKLSELGVNLDDYDLIFLGYPIWWADLPMPVYSFLENNNFRGKTIVLFSSHGGSGLAGTVATITRLLPTARVIQDGFTVSRDSVVRSQPLIASWMNGLVLVGGR